MGREQLGLGDVEGEGQFFVGNLEREIFGGARGEASFYLLFFLFF